MRHLNEILINVFVVLRKEICLVCICNNINNKAFVKKYKFSGESPGKVWEIKYNFNELKVNQVF